MHLLRKKCVQCSSNVYCILRGADLLLGSIFKSFLYRYRYLLGGEPSDLHCDVSIVN